MNELVCNITHIISSNNFGFILDIPIFFLEVTHGKNHYYYKDDELYICIHFNRSVDEYWTMTELCDAVIHELSHILSSDDNNEKRNFHNIKYEFQKRGLYTNIYNYNNVDEDEYIWFSEAPELHKCKPVYINPLDFE